MSERSNKVQSLKEVMEQIKYEQLCGIQGPDKPQPEEHSRWNEWLDKDNNIEEKTMVEMMHLPMCGGNLGFPMN